MLQSLENIGDICLFFNASPQRKCIPIYKIISSHRTVVSMFLYQLYANMDLEITIINSITSQSSPCQHKHNGCGIDNKVVALSLRFHSILNRVGLVNPPWPYLRNNPGDDESFIPPEVGLLTELIPSDSMGQDGTGSRSSPVSF